MRAHRTRTRLAATISPSMVRDKGTVHISGYKHASNLIIIAAILFPKITFVLKNIPDVLDTKILLEILERLGASVSFIRGVCTLNTAHMQNKEIPTDLSEKVHGALYLLPALLCRFGEVVLGKCGGCPIGETDVNGNSRPVSHIIHILECFGAKFNYENRLIKGKLDQWTLPDEIDIQEYSDDPIELTGQYVSGATKAAILTALALDKKVVIKNPYIKADVREFLDFLRKIPVAITCENEALTIKNVGNGATTCVEHSVMSDINEIFTYITFAVVNNVELTLINITVDTVRVAYIQEEMAFKQMGIELQWLANSIVIKKSTAVVAMDFNIGQAEKYSVYADHQPFIVLLLTLANQSATVRDLVWSKRFHYAAELAKMGYNLQEVDGALKIMPGIRNVFHAPDYLIGHDVRAAAVVIIAAIKYNKEINIIGIEHLERGYEKFFEKLQSLDVNISLNTLAIA